MKKIEFSQLDIKNKLIKLKKWFKKHYITFFKEIPLLLCFIITALINTLMLRVLTVGNFFYVKPLFVDLGMIFILSSFMFLFKKNVKRQRYLIILSLISAIICIINSIYYSYYNSFVSISLLATSTFVGDVGDAVVEKVLRFRDFFYLWQPVFVYYFYVRQNNKNKIVTSNSSINRKFYFTNMFVSGIVLLLIISVFMTKTEWSRFGKMWNRESVVSSFGIYTYQINDIIQSLEPKINNLFGHDSALKKVNDYYNSLEYDNKKNKYTGIFEGKNVIVIHAESLQTLALESSFNGVDVAPFLKKMANESIYFSNYYSQVGVGTSSDAEFTFSTSLMPSSSGTVFVNYFDREYSSIQKAFNNKGYYTFSMHGNVGDFWNRAVMHKNIGYDKFYSKSSFEIDEEIGLGLSDKSFFKQVVPFIKEINDNNEKFYGTLITLTNHTPWSDLDLMDEYDTTMTVEINGEKVVREYLNGTTLGDYFRSVHYMDQAIEEFINDLDKEGILDDTIVVIYGDHDARISKNDYDILYNYDPYSDSVRNEKDDGYINYNKYEYKLDKNVPFMIWSKNKDVIKEVDTVTGMIDAYPILENLFNLDRNVFKLGNDILGKDLDDNTVVFTDGSYVTNKIYYNGQNGDIYPIGGVSVDSSYVKENANKADLIIDISNDIIAYDLLKEINENK